MKKRVQISEILSFVVRFQAFCVLCLISIVDIEMAESLVMSKLSAIKRPYQIRQSHGNCSDLVGSFILSIVDKKDATAHPLRRNGFRHILLQAATCRDFNRKEPGKAGAYQRIALPSCQTLFTGSA
jgi:hypothetical protein